MARTHKPPTLGHDEYENDEWRERAREKQTEHGRIRERATDEETEREGRNERGKTSGRRDRGGEEGHRCVRGVPETAYGNGGVC
jgi:hypothetical protein